MPSNLPQSIPGFKFDGKRVRLFTVREFHQLAGRAGRPGFDPDGAG